MSTIVANVVKFWAHKTCEISFQLGAGWLLGVYDLVMPQIASTVQNVHVIRSLDCHTDALMCDATCFLIASNCRQYKLSKNFVHLRIYFNLLLEFWKIWYRTSGWTSTFCIKCNCISALPSRVATKWKHRKNCNFRDEFVRFVCFFPAVNYGTLLWMNRNLPIVREQWNDRAQKVLQQNWSCHCLFHCCAEHCSLFFTIFGKYMTWNFFHKCFVIAFLSFWRWFAFKNTNKLFPANAFSLIHSCFSFGRINSVSLCVVFFSSCSIRNKFQ